MSWFPRTKKCVALSTIEAKYVVMNGRRNQEGPICEGVVPLLMPSLGPMCRIIDAFEDTKQAEDSAKKPLISSKSKHIDVRYYLLRELRASGDISVKYLRSENQLADHH